MGALDIELLGSFAMGLRDFSMAFCFLVECSPVTMFLHDLVSL